MLTTVLILFFVLLLIGVPVAHLVLIAGGVGILGSGLSGTLIAQQSVLGLNSFVVLAVPFFIISGDFASKGKTSEKIVNVFNAFLGRVPGGLGIATVFACAFFGAITGSAIATVVAIGALMFPKLLEAGYPKSLAIGILTCGGTLGVMIPPSIPMLLMAVSLKTNVAAQFTAGFLPGMMTALLMCVWVFLSARRHKLPLGPKLTFREKMSVVKDSFWGLMFPVIVLGSIYGGLATPTEAAVISVLYVVLVEALIYKEITLKGFWKQMGESCVNAATMSFFMATAQVFVYYMTMAKVPSMLMNTVAGAISNPLTLMLLLCGLFLIVGCFTNVGTVVIILGPILLPLLQHYGINTYQFVIIATLMAQIGFVTPPFGLCLFVSMKVAKTDMVEVTKGAVPFLVCMLLAVILLILFPDIATLLPNLLYGVSG